MRRNKATWIWVIIVALILIGLFLYPRLNASKEWAGVPCLVPRLPLVGHLHPRLLITIDGANEPIPAGIGLSPACEHAIHTHDDDAAQGIIHVESQDRRVYTLGDFFSVWEKTIDREGFSLEATVDGAIATEPAKILFKDGGEILLKYNKITNNQ